MRDSVTNVLYKERLLDTLRKFRNNEAKERKFLIDCLDRHGYISKRNISEPDFDSEVEYSEIVNDPFDFTQQEYEYSDSNTINQRFQRTFIQDLGKSKLSEFQKRGITNQETEFNKVSETIDTALNALTQIKHGIDVHKVKQDALDMYLKIMNYYLTGNNVRDEIEANTKGIKKGYIFLVVMYALLNNQVVITDDNLIRFFDNGVALQDLVKPRRYLEKILFKNSPKPKMVSSVGDCSIILRQLPQKAQKQVAEIIKNFNPEYTSAAIYYVCNVTVEKHGISPVKIKIGSQAITQKYLEEMCKPPSSSVISSRAKEITNFYNSHYELKEQLMFL
jgi:hypothetical protein